MAQQQLVKMLLIQTRWSLFLCALNERSIIICCFPLSACPVFAFPVAGPFVAAQTFCLLLHRRFACYYIVILLVVIWLDKGV